MSCKGRTTAQVSRDLTDAVTIWNYLPTGWWHSSDLVQAWVDVLLTPRLFREWIDEEILIETPAIYAIHNRRAREIVARILQDRIDSADLGDLVQIGGTS